MNCFSMVPKQFWDLFRKPNFIPKNEPVIFKQDYFYLFLFFFDTSDLIYRMFKISQRTRWSVNCQLFWANLSLLVNGENREQNVLKCWVCTVIWSQIFSLFSLNLASWFTIKPLFQINHNGPINSKISEVRFLIIWPN